MRENTSPEEKLLKHLRGGQNGPSNIKGAGAQKSAATVPFSDVATRKESGRNVLAGLYKILIVLSIFFAGTIAYQFSSPKKDVNRLVRETQTKIKKIPQEVVLKKPKSYSVYAAEINKRDIFTPPSERKKGQEEDNVSTVSELTKGLRLVGIVLDETAEAIIEDIESKQTFFVHEGESIRGAIVEEIQESKVILLQGEERIELIQ